LFGFYFWRSNNWRYLFWFFLIIFIFLFFISLFRKYENIDADESNNHTDDLDDIGPLGVGEPCNDHLPGTFLVIDGLDWPRFSILEGKTHEYKSD
jgi:hypothetical protein